MDKLKNIVFSKIYDYKSNDGKFCYVNENEKNFIINLPTSKVIFDVDYTFNRPTLTIGLVDAGLIEFIDAFGKEVINYVYQNSKKIYNTQKSLNSLEEFYCSPHKKSLAKKNYTDTLKMKLLNQKINPLSRNTKIDIVLHISGIWFSNDSFGPYFDVMDLTLVELPHIRAKNVYSFVAEELSDDEITIN